MDNKIDLKKYDVLTKELLEDRELSAAAIMCLEEAAKQGRKQRMDSLKLQEIEPIVKEFIEQYEENEEIDTGKLYARLKNALKTV